MNYSHLRTIYEKGGPYATVYLEGRSPSADAATQIRLRWEELREQLSDNGADESLLESIDAVVLVDEPTEVHTDGRIIVATSEGVLLDEHWDAALGDGDAAHYGQVPELGAFLRQESRQFDVILVIAGQDGATVRELSVTPDRERSENDGVHVTGDNDEEINKPRRGAYSHNQIRRRVDEIIKDHARTVADFVDRLITEHAPDALVLAGEVQGRTVVKAELSVRAEEMLHEISEGGDEDAGAEEATDVAIRTLVTRLAEEREAENSDRLGESKAHDRAVEGRAEVEKAVRRGAVATLLLDDAEASEGEAEIVAEAILSSAEIGLSHDPMSDGIAAILRYDVGAALAD
ncbi:Vms1/Ankzf1 family peptidyl-tRNA hydrolase [Brevibacterium renqingii]|uniref:baeRF2 domain-containing protein n=1 Tax=Brevibacterium renqingii TaxID=2776916 RepID=UPI001AE0C847|nr:Vms1/Ankzf1 family peptidyl-tRNA hydrolase [Brevibacterium renqingii]